MKEDLYNYVKANQGVSSNLVLYEFEVSTGLSRDEIMAEVLSLIITKRLKIINNNLEINE